LSSEMCVITTSRRGQVPDVDGLDLGTPTLYCPAP